MSVVFALLKVVDNVDYVGGYLDHLKPSEITIENIDKIEAELGRPGEGISPAEIGNVVEDWVDGLDRKAWADNQKHFFFDWTYYRSLHRNSRGWRRQEEKMSKYNLKNFVVNSISHDYLTTDLVNEYYGWCLKPKFFKKKMPFTICTSKKEINNFFKRYGKNDELTAIIQNRVLNEWTDDCLFVVSW